jgi:hypothetical protein
MKNITNITKSQCDKVLTSSQRNIPLRAIFVRDSHSSQLDMAA